MRLALKDFSWSVAGPDRLAEGPHRLSAGLGHVEFTPGGDDLRVAELTALLDLTGWPAGMRLTCQCR